MSNEISNPSETKRPQFLAPVDRETGKVGAELAKEYQRPTFAKIIQPQSSDELQEKWGVGSLVAFPDEKLLIELGSTALVTPVYLYREFCIHNNYDSGLEEFIRERTFDPENEIASKCRSRNQDDWTVDENGTYAEHLNAVVIFDGVDSIGPKPIVITWYKGGWKYGANFFNDIDILAGNHICEFRLQASLKKLKYKNNTYYAVEITTPEDGNYYVQDETLYNFAVEQHNKCKEAFSTGGLQVNYEVETDKETESEFS